MACCQFTQPDATTPALSGEWVVGLGLFALLLALVWQAWFPGLRDSSPEQDNATGPSASGAKDAQPPHDLPG